MKKKIYLSVLLLILVSCSNVVFITPQPEGLKPLDKIPESLQGLYVLFDSIMVTSNSINGDTLGKDIIVKKRGNFYYLNFFEDDCYSLTVIKVVQAVNYEDFTVFHPRISENNKYFFSIVGEKKTSNAFSNSYKLENVSVIQLSKMLKEDDNNLIRIK